jgi:protein SCO1/2
MKTPLIKLTCVLMLVLLGLGGCAKRPANPAKTAAVPTYELRGEIVDVNREKQTLLVHHEEIPGYMPAMTMEFTAPGASMAAFKEGQHITAHMIPSATGEFRLEGIQIANAQTANAVATAAKALRQDTLIRGKSAYREIGENAPAFTLTNQNGEAVTIDQFRGKQIVLNFIYTRCPVPTMCPASTAKMMALQAAAKQAGKTNLQLISISFDAAYDTPPVLRAYAEARGIDTTNFSFLTGPEDAIRDLLVQFGILVESGENIFKHSLSTVLIDANGKIIHRADGSAWDPNDFLRRL